MAIPTTFIESVKFLLLTSRVRKSPLTEEKSLIIVKRIEQAIASKLAVAPQSGLDIPTMTELLTGTCDPQVYKALANCQWGAFKRAVQWSKLIERMVSSGLHQGVMICKWAYINKEIDPRAYLEDGVRLRTDPLRADKGTEETLFIVIAKAITSRKFFVCKDEDERAELVIQEVERLMYCIGDEESPNQKHYSFVKCSLKPGYTSNRALLGTIYKGWREDLILKNRSNENIPFPRGGKERASSLAQYASSTFEASFEGVDAARIAHAADRATRTAEWAENRAQATKLKDEESHVLFAAEDQATSRVSHKTQRPAQTGRVPVGELSPISDEDEQATTTRVAEKTVKPRSK